MAGTGDIQITIIILIVAEDAREAVDSGVDGIVVSNHGGRQLDGVPATVLCLLAVFTRFVRGTFTRASDCTTSLAQSDASFLFPKKQRGRPVGRGLDMCA